MSAVIVGSPSSGSKVLRRADFSTQRNGLETLNEVYTVRTADRKTLQPSFGTLHSAYSTASTTFARMAVENFSFREQDGDLTEINVTYVGLTSSSGLPPAVVRAATLVTGPPTARDHAAATHSGDTVPKVRANRWRSSPSEACTSRTGHSPAAPPTGPPTRRHGGESWRVQR